MRYPQLPYYYYLPLAIILLFFTLSLAFAKYYSFGSWDHTRTVNWGHGLFPPGTSLETVSYANTVISSFPSIGVAVYFLRRFLKRSEVNLVGSILIGLAGFLFSVVLMAMIR